MIRPLNPYPSLLLPGNKPCYNLEINPVIARGQRPADPNSKFDNFKPQNNTPNDAFMGYNCYEYPFFFKQAKIQIPHSSLITNN